MADQPTDEQFNDAIRILFTTDGWKYFIQELIANYEQLDTLNSCNDEKSLFYNKGQAAAIANIINMEDVMNLAEENAAEEAADEVAESVH